MWRGDLIGNWKTDNYFPKKLKQSTFFIFLYFSFLFFFFFPPPFFYVQEGPFSSWKFLKRNCPITTKLLVLFFSLTIIPLHVVFSWDFPEENLGELISNIISTLGIGSFAVTHTWHVERASDCTFRLTHIDEETSRSSPVFHNKIRLFNLLGPVSAQSPLMPQESPFWDTFLEC